MSAVDPQFAQWLQGAADYTVRSNATMAARWGATAKTTERITAIALKTDADAEADRQLAFFARGPFAVDEHQLIGTDWGPSLGRVVTLTAAGLGYDAGLDVFVTGVDVDRATGLTTLTVLCPLGPSS
ncbi:hypothetical protein [Sphingomonas sp.]|uniref:hypothetical protein n=1 Tax=Sphingomonas sp. TaxID=28214 RepID=UPI003CC534BE